MGEIDFQSLLFIAFYYQRLHKVAIELIPRWSFLRIYPSLRSLTGRYHPKKELDLHQLFGKYNLCTSRVVWGTRRKLLVSLFLCLLALTYHRLNFPCKTNELISLIRLVEISIVDNLYSKAESHKVSNVFR
jgi:hypothetical protein